MVEWESPRRLVEAASSAGGKRVTRDTYLLERAADGGSLAPEAPLFLSLA